MPRITLYLNDQDFELYKKLPKRRASYIFSQTLKEDAGIIESIPTLDKQINLIREEIDMKQSSLNFLQSNKARLERKEQEMLAEKQKIEEKEKFNTQYLLDFWKEDFKNNIGREMTLEDIKVFKDQKSEPDGYENIAIWIDFLAGKKPKTNRERSSWR